jgi:hypothetical protein
MSAALKTLITLSILIAMFGWLTVGASKTNHKTIEEWLDVLLGLCILLVFATLIWLTWS